MIFEADLLYLDPHLHISFSSLKHLCVFGKSCVSYHQLGSGTVRSHTLFQACIVAETEVSLGTSFSANGLHDLDGALCNDTNFAANELLPHLAC